MFYGVLSILENKSTCDRERHTSNLELSKAKEKISHDW